MFTLDELNNHLNSLRETLGEESSALISEGLIQIVTNYSNALNQISEYAEEISNLKARNEELLAVNGKLYLQVGSLVDKPETDYENEKKEEEIKIDEIIDEKGELI